MDFEKMCRCCLNAKRENKNIHSTIEIDGKQEVISGVFLNCLNVEMTSEDGFPQNICIFCITTLQMTHSFKRILENSKNILMQYLENKICSYDDTSTNVEFLCTSNEAEDVKQYCPQVDFINSPVQEANPEKQFTSNTHIYVPPVKEKSINKSKDPNPYYFCTICSCRFSERRKLYKHCCSHHPQIKQMGRPCDYCNERFDDFQSLLVHRRKHLTPYVCSLCWKGFMEETKLTEHVNTCKSKEIVTEKVSVPKKIMCHICGKSYPVGYIKIHMLIHGESKIKCKYCGKNFKQPCNLNSHIIWNHTREKTHKCEFCKMVFMTSSTRTRHVRKIHKEEKNVICSLCGKRFFCAAGLKRHMLSHTGVKSFTCDHCDKAYQTRYGLNVHLKSHHI